MASRGLLTSIICMTDGENILANGICREFVERIVKDMKLAETSYRWKTLWDMGATVSNGSDCPVEWPNVLGGIQCAVTRCDLRGNGPYLPEEAFSVEQALDSFTKCGAWASFEEKKKGTIAPGMLADFVILGESPFAAALEQIDKIPVLSTYLAGHVVYRAQD